MMDNPNYLALSVLIVIIFHLIHLSVKSQASLLWSWGVIFFLCYIFVIAGSRTAFIVIVAGLLGVIWFTSIRQKVALATGGVALFFVLSTTGTIQINRGGPLILFNRLEKTDYTKDPRIAAWQGVMRAAIANRFAGMGIGQFKHRFREFYYDSNDPLIQRILMRGYFLSPHSDYFALLVIYGIVGLILYLFYLFFIVKERLRLIRISDDLNDKKFHQFALLGIVALMLFGVTAENFNSAIYWLILAVSTKTWA